MRVRRERLDAHPALRGRTAEVRVDDADRHAVPRREVAREEECRSTQVENGRGRYGRPLPAGQVGPRPIEVEFARYGDVTDQRQVGCRDVGFEPVAHAFHRQLHVRLPGSDPDIAEQYVADFDSVAGLDADRVRAAGRLRRQCRAPFAAGRDGFRDGLAIEQHANALAVVGPAPERYFRIALQDDAVADEARQANVGRGSSRCEYEQQCKLHARDRLRSVVDGKSSVVRAALRPATLLK